MLRDKQNDLMHLLTMLEALEKIILFSQDAADAESFYQLNEQMNLNAVLNLLVHIGETSRKLSDDLLEASPDIEWQKIRGLRNRIAHNYPGLDTFLVFQTVRNDVPRLRDHLYQITYQRIQENVFDTGELAVAIDSTYYRHVNFSLLITHDN